MRSRVASPRSLCGRARYLADGRAYSPARRQDPAPPCTRVVQADPRDAPPVDLFVPHDAEETYVLAERSCDVGAPRARCGSADVNAAPSAPRHRGRRPRSSAACAPCSERTEEPTPLSLRKFLLACPHAVARRAAATRRRSRSAREPGLRSGSGGRVGGRKRKILGAGRPRARRESSKFSDVNGPTKALRRSRSTFAFARRRSGAFTLRISRARRPSGDRAGTQSAEATFVATTARRSRR